MAANSEGMEEGRQTTVVYASPESHLLRALGFCTAATGFMGAMGVSLTAWKAVSHGFSLEALTVIVSFVLMLAPSIVTSYPLLLVAVAH